MRRPPSRWFEIWLLIAAIVVMGFVRSASACSGLLHLGKTMMIESDSEVGEIAVCQSIAVGSYWEFRIKSTIIDSGQIQPDHENLGGQWVFRASGVRRGEVVKFCVRRDLIEDWFCSRWMLARDHDYDRDGVIGGDDFAQHRANRFLGIETERESKPFGIQYKRKTSPEITAGGVKVWR